MLPEELLEPSPPLVPGGVFERLPPSPPESLWPDWPPNGSWYWSSPAPCAKATEGTASARASRQARRRERVTAVKSRAEPGGTVPRRVGLHILILTDRDWTHPQGGGTGTNLYGQVARWLAWGHRVTVVAGDYEGAARTEQLAEGLVVHRMGTRVTVFPRAAWATLRGLARDADVVLEVVNGIAFGSPAWRWMSAPTV